MTTRLRVVAYVVQPQLMTDDGEHLTAITVNPVTIAAADWSNVVETMAAGIEQLRQQVENPTGSPPPEGE